MTTKHTPGPWVVVEHPHSICVQTESPSKTKYGASRYAAIGGFDRNDRAQLEEARANACLIAAAPDLLRLLREARRTLEMWKDVAPAVSLCADIDAAIARATGEHP